MIPPDQIDRGAISQLYQYMEREIRQALADRKQMERNWERYHRLYRAKPEMAIREFPFIGASNLVIPLIATDVDTTFSRILGLLFSHDNLWSMRASRPDWMEFAARLQEFIQIVQEKELNAYESTANFTLELCKLGTAVLKQRYKREHKQVYQFRETPMGVTEQVMNVLVKDHPQQDWVRLENFLLPAGASDIQSAPWVAEKVSLTWGQYLNRVREGVYSGADRIKSWMANEKGGRVLEALMRLEPYTPGIGDKLEFWECWLDFDVSGSGRPIGIVMTVHLPTRTIVRLDYNPFMNQEKPYSAARFLRVEGRFYGIGMAEMLEHFQEETTAMHNQRIDAGTIANAPMFKATRDAKVKKNEPVFPGKWFILDNIDDVQAMHMGDLKFVSNTQYEATTLQYANRRTGVNDYITGASQAHIGYAALGTNVMQHEESVKRFDHTLREVRKALSESGMRLVELYQQFNQGGKPFTYMGPEDGQVVQAVLQFPYELIRMGMVVDVTATSASASKETEIRTNTIVMQMLQQFYGQMMQAMQIALNPQIPEPMRQLAMTMMTGQNTVMRRVLDNYGVQDLDQLLPRMGDALNGNGRAIGAIGAAFNGGPPGTQGPVPPSGVPYPNGGSPGIPGGIPTAA